MTQKSYQSIKPDGAATSRTHCAASMASDTAPPPLAQSIRPGAMQAFGLPSRTGYIRRYRDGRVQECKP